MRNASVLIRRPSNIVIVILAYLYFSVHAHYVWIAHPLLIRTQYNRMENLIQMLAIRSAIKLAAANDCIWFHSQCRGQACIVPGAVSASVCALQICCFCKKDHQVNQRFHDWATEEPCPAAKRVNSRLFCRCSVVVTWLVSGNALHLIFYNSSIKHRNPYAFKFFIARVNKADRLITITLCDREVYNPVASDCVFLLVNLHRPYECTAIIVYVGNV